MKYEFTVEYKLADGADDIDAIVERLGEAGCTDALVGIGQPGRITLAFGRDANSAEGAVLSALRDVRTALPAARLVEVRPDIVGLTDVADIVGVTRQNMRKLLQTHARAFPAPVHAGKVVLWHLAQVLEWLKDRRTYRIDSAVLDVSRVAMQVNLAKESTQIEPHVGHEVRRLIA